MANSNQKQPGKVVFKDAEEQNDDFTEKSLELYEIAGANQESAQLEEENSYKVVPPNSLKSVWILLGALLSLTPFTAW